jgi:hypothetical protein
MLSPEIVTSRDREIVLMRLIWEQMEARRDELLNRLTPEQKQASEVRADRIRALKADVLAARKRISNQKAS